MRNIFLVQALCLIFLQTTTTLAGTGSSAGDGTQPLTEGSVPRFQMQKPTEQTQFDILLKLYNNTKTSFSSNISAYIPDDSFKFFTLNNRIFSSDGKQFTQLYSRFLFQISVNGYGVYRSNVKAEEEIGSKIDYTLNIGFISPEITDEEYMNFKLGETEDVAQTPSGQQIRLKSGQSSDNSRFIIGIITSNSEGKCNKRNLIIGWPEDSPEEYQPVNDVCNVFYVR